MRHATIYTTDEEFNHFVELAKNLHYVKKIETDSEPNKTDILENIKTGLKEVKLYKKGKLKTTSAKDFLNEL
jgi:protein-arginine kinase